MCNMCMRRIYITPSVRCLHGRSLPLPPRPRRVLAPWFFAAVIGAIAGDGRADGEQEKEGEIPGRLESGQCRDAAAMTRVLVCRCWPIAANLASRTLCNVRILILLAWRGPVVRCRFFFQIQSPMQCSSSDLAFIIAHYDYRHHSHRHRHHHRHLHYHILLP